MIRSLWTASTGLNAQQVQIDIIAIIGVVIAVFVAIGVGNRAGKRAARKEAKRETALEAAERQAATRKRMDEADTGNDDPAVLRDWLRERGQ